MKIFERKNKCEQTKNEQIKNEQTGYWTKSYYAKNIDDYEIGKIYNEDFKRCKYDNVADAIKYPSDCIYEVVERRDNITNNTLCFEVKRKVPYNDMSLILESNVGICTEDEYEESKEYSTYDEWLSHKITTYLEKINLSLEYKCRIERMLLCDPLKFRENCEKILLWEKEVDKNMLVYLIETQITKSPTQMELAMGLKGRIVLGQFV